MVSTPVGESKVASIKNIYSFYQFVDVIVNNIIEKPSHQANGNHPSYYF
jgi:hypothetical protein